MDIAAYIREIGRGALGAKSLDMSSACLLYQAVLQGQIPELELGALLLALRMKGESVEEMLGFLQAIETRLPPLSLPENLSCPVVIPSYNGARRMANLTPLLALLCKKLGLPVLIHGHSADFGRVTTATILAQLGYPPASDCTQIGLRLRAEGLVFVPLSVLSPGLAQQIDLRARLGLRNCAHSLVKMLDPFRGQQLSSVGGANPESVEQAAGGVLLATATHPEYLGLMRTILLSRSQSALLFRATEGEPFANPKRCPTIECLSSGQACVFYEGEHDSLRRLPSLPADIDASSTARWTEAVLAGREPIPEGILRQLLACLVLGKYVPDIHAAYTHLQDCLGDQGKLSLL